MHIVLYVSHVDDDILGAGGSIPQFVEQGHDVSIVYVTDGELHPPKNVDNRAKALRAVSVMNLNEDDIYFLSFDDQRFDNEALIDINKRFESLGLDPDLIITNSKHDVNQDHRTVFESAMVIGRSIDSQIGILTCEVVSSSEWFDVPFEPNFYIDISDTIDKKIEAMREIDTELESWPHPRSERGIQIKAQQRGMEVGMNYAEAFRVVRWFDWQEPLTPGPTTTDS